MTLKVELKPGERIIVGTAVIRNGETRARFQIEGEAPILREKDILTPATADSPAKKIYLAVQLMYLTGDLSAHHAFYFPLVQECEKGVHRWIEIPAAGKSGHDLAEPAPALKLLPKR